MIDLYIIVLMLLIVYIGTYIFPSNESWNTSF